MLYGRTHAGGDTKTATCWLRNGYAGQLHYSPTLLCGVSDREAHGLCVCIAGVGYLMAQWRSAQTSVPESPCLPLDAAAALPRCWCNGYRYSDACGQLRELCGSLEGIVSCKKRECGLGFMGGEIA
jgi:hypothetical protein